MKTNPDIQFSVTLTFPKTPTQFIELLSKSALVITKADELVTEVTVVSHELQTVIDAVNAYVPAFDPCRRLEVYKTIRSSY